MNPVQSASLPAQLTVVAYPDVTVETLGFGPEHPYIEESLLALVGPSATLLWKRLARLVIAANPDPVTVDTADLLACLGLGQGLAKNSIGARTIARIVNFDLARQAGRDGTLLAVRTAAAPFNEVRAGRLSGSARRYHDHITATGGPADRFRLGKLHVAPGALTALAHTGTDPVALLERHQRGDWGDVNTDETIANNAAVTDHGLIHSVYDLAGTVVWVLTAGDRHTTTIITPDEY